MSRAGSGSVPRRKAEEEPIDLDEIDDVEEEEDDDDDDDDDGEEYEVESILDSKLEVS
jgi:hypothetical protein